MPSKSGEPFGDFGLGKLLKGRRRPKRPVRFLIWSPENQAWRLPGGMGYTSDLMEAGRFTRAEALGICRNALPDRWHPARPLPELPIREIDLAHMLETPRVAHNP
jgi:hypothetical protein